MQKTTCGHTRALLGAFLLRTVAHSKRTACIAYRPQSQKQLRPGWTHKHISVPIYRRYLYFYYFSSFTDSPVDPSPASVTGPAHAPTHIPTTLLPSLNQHTTPPTPSPVRLSLLPPAACLSTQSISPSSRASFPLAYPSPIRPLQWD
jgi:hypothetical protein